MRRRGFAVNITAGEDRCRAAQWRKERPTIILTNMPDTLSLLLRGLAALEIDLGERLDILVRYVDQLETWNPSYGFVNASGQELIVKHILDSLAPWRLIKATLEECDLAIAAKEGQGSATLSDIGTGPGLPGIPLSLAFPERKIRLVERMNKRVTFLESQKLVLPLANVEIIESEIEKAPVLHDVAVFRAFRPFTEVKLFKAIWQSLRPGGALFAYKGKPFNAKTEIAALAADPLLSGPFAKAEIRSLWVPFLQEERCAVIVRKPLP